MQPITKIWIGIVVFGAIAAFLNAWFGTLNFWSILITPFYIMIVAGISFFLKNAHKKDLQELENKEKTRKTLDYCWNKANEIIRGMPSGKALQWASGFNKKVTMRYFERNNRWYPYRAMYGYTEDKQLVLVIYDIVRDDIAHYDSDAELDAEVMRDPFTNFKPFGESRGGFGYDRFDRDKKYRDSRFNINVNSDKRNYEPDSQMVSDIMSGEKT